MAIAFSTTIRFASRDASTPPAEDQAKCNHALGFDAEPRGFKE
jgi:hypothetical protein